MLQKIKLFSCRQYLKTAGPSTASRMLVALTLATLILVACEQIVVVTPAPAGETTEEMTAETAEEAVEEIRVLVVGDPFQFALQEVVDDFTEQTGIKVNLENLAYDALNARLVTSFVSNTPDADVIVVDQMWTGQYMDNGWITPLDDYIKNDCDTDIQDFIPEVLYSLNTWRGQMATLPIAAYGQGVMYRTDVFEQAGLEAPPNDPDNADGWTWDRYIEILNELHGTEFDGTEMFGTVIVGSQPVPVVHMYTQLAASNGVEWFTQFPEADWDFEPTINTPENVAALNTYKDLYDLSPPEAINYVWFDAGTRYSQGDIGMFYWWTPYFYLINNNGYMTGEPSVVADKTGIAVLPKVSDDAPQVTSLGGWSLGIPSSSAAKDEGWEFIKWATSAETQKKMGEVPDWNFQFSDFARKSLYEDADLNEVYPYLDTQLKILSQGNGKIVRPPVSIYSTLEGIYGLQINKVLAGDLSAEDSLAEADTLFRNALSGNLMLPYQLESYDDTYENTLKLIDDLACE